MFVWPSALVPNPAPCDIRANCFPETPYNRAAMQIKILTYNIHRAIGIDRRFRPDRIVEILAHHQADIVLLQEVDVGVPRSRHYDMASLLAQEAGYPHYALGLNVPVKTGYYGNATLSRFPITARHNIDLTVANRKNRGCIYTPIALPEFRNNKPEILHAFNLHLGLSSLERIQQIGSLCRSPHYTVISQNELCLIGGDLNDWRGFLGPIFTDILGFSSATDHKQDCLDPILSYPAFSPTGGLDRLFFRGPASLVSSRRCRLRVAKLASDHLPVIADLETSS